MPSPTCVMGRDKLWHALAGSAKLDPNASIDQLRCGGVMVMRWRSERRAPTCPDCRKRQRPA